MEQNMTRVQRTEFLLLKLRDELVVRNRHEINALISELDALAAQAPPSYDVHADPEPEPTPTTQKHKPCPFCGGTAVIKHGAMGAGCCVRCLKCGVESAYTLSESVAWTAWDSRVDDTRLSRLREWLRAEQDIVSHSLKPDVLVAFELAVEKLDSL
jgi:hypothetical protein